MVFDSLPSEDLFDQLDFHRFPLLLPILTLEDKQCLRNRPVHFPGAWSLRSVTLKPDQQRLKEAARY